MRPSDHDASYKLLLCARELVLGFIPDEWLRSLDYSKPEKEGSIPFRVEPNIHNDRW